MLMPRPRAHTTYLRPIEGNLSPQKKVHLLPLRVKWIWKLLHLNLCNPCQIESNQAIQHLTFL